MHFHIRWLANDKIDWLRFNSKDEAEELAKDIVFPGEEYTIEGFDEACPTCADARKRAKLD